MWRWSLTHEGLAVFACRRNHFAGLSKLISKMPTSEKTRVVCSRSIVKTKPTRCLYYKLRVKTRVYAHGTSFANACVQAEGMRRLIKAEDVGFEAYRQILCTSRLAYVSDYFVVHQVCSVSCSLQAVAKGL